jgi:hypothetical protein
MADLNELRRKAEADALDALKRYIAHRQRSFDTARRMDPASKFAHDTSRLLDKARKDYAVYARSIGIEVDEPEPSEDLAHETAGAVEPATLQPGGAAARGGEIRVEHAAAAEPVAPIADRVERHVASAHAQAGDQPAPAVVVPATFDSDRARRGDETVRTEQAFAAEVVAASADHDEQHISPAEAGDHPAPADVAPATFDSDPGDHGVEIVRAEQAIAAEVAANVDPAEKQVSPSEAADQLTPAAFAPAAVDTDRGGQGPETVHTTQAAAAEAVAANADPVEKHAPLDKAGSGPSELVDPRPKKREAADDKFIAALMETASELSTKPEEPLPEKPSRPRLFGRSNEIPRPAQAPLDPVKAPGEPTRPTGGVHPLLNDPLDAFGSWSKDRT